MQKSLFFQYRLLQQSNFCDDHGSFFQYVTFLKFAFDKNEALNQKTIQDHYSVRHGHWPKTFLILFDLFHRLDDTFQIHVTPNKFQR